MAIDSVRDAIALVNATMRHGDDKYGVNAWLFKPKTTDLGERIEDHIAAADRHLKRRMGSGMEPPAPIDADSRLPAMAHVAARALMALQLEIQSSGLRVIEIIENPAMLPDRWCLRPRP